MYKLFFRPLLFLFDAECIHKVVTKIVAVSFVFPILGSILKKIFYHEDKTLNVNVSGLKFKNPVGLAAGFDKNATLYKSFSNFGFGFIEIGTVTPKPQPGNPRKRMFRLIQDKAIINRMGFNNDGVIAIKKRLKGDRPKSLIIGGNIGINATTEKEKRVDDYITCFNQLFDEVDYFTINISSPNTSELRAFHKKESLSELLGNLQKENKSKINPKPIFLKIAPKPDLDDVALLDVIRVVEQTQIAGIVTTNTTTSRDGLKSKYAKEKGGLSGLPLKDKSNETIKFIADNRSTNTLSIIATGGILFPEDAIEKLKAGADLVQIYTGLIYTGPFLIKDIKKAISSKVASKEIRLTGADFGSLSP